MPKRTTRIRKAVDPLEKPEKFSLGAIGIDGASVYASLPRNEIKNELNFPHNRKTYKQMMLHPAVNASISLYKSMLSKATYRFIAPKNPTAKEKMQTLKVEQMFADMSISLPDVISSALISLEYGFAPLEKIFKYRDGVNSAYSDGLIGISKLALRHPDTVENFIFDADTAEVVGLKQNLLNLVSPFGQSSVTSKPYALLPKEKIMCFTLGVDKSNPYGTSPLRNVYLPWKYLQAIEELEASGVAKDLQGLPVIRIPATYMAADASPENKAVYENIKNIVRNLQNNTQSGVVLPSEADPETRLPMFTLELLSTEGKKSFDTTKIKEYYRTMIFIGLAADILLMGNTQVGSFALGAIKNTMTGSAVEGILKHIVSVFNEDLIKQIYQLNGWDIVRRCTLDYEGFDSVDADSYSKFFQRIASVGGMPITLEVINDVLNKMGLDELPEDTNLDDILPEKKSRAGEGMQTAGEGLATDPTGKDSSSLNTENA